MLFSLACLIYKHSFMKYKQFVLFTSISVIEISHCSYFVSKVFKICQIISYWDPANCVAVDRSLLMSTQNVVLNLSFTDAIMLLTISIYISTTKSLANRFLGTKIINIGYEQGW